MKYIKPNDYSYIMNKYHDLSKPFNPFLRYIRHDEIFSSDSGMAPEDILAGIVELDRENQSLSHPERKALALAFVLKNPHRYAVEEVGGAANDIHVS